LIEEERERYSQVPRVHHAISCGVDDTGDEEGGIEFDEVKFRCFWFDTERAGGGFTKDSEELMRNLSHVVCEEIKEIAYSAHQLVPSAA
jgi:hypothetical protein